MSPGVISQDLLNLGKTLHLYHLCYISGICVWGIGARREPDRAVFLLRATEENLQDFIEEIYAKCHNLYRNDVVLSYI